MLSHGLVFSVDKSLTDVIATGLLFDGRRFGVSPSTDTAVGFFMNETASISAINLRFHYDSLHRSGASCSVMIGVRATARLTPYMTGCSSVNSSLC